MKNLFQFENSTTGNAPMGSPRLVPASGGGIKNLAKNLSKNFLKSDSINNSTDGMIDVVDGFYWTTSQRSSRQDVPYGILKEKRLKNNALIAQLAYFSHIYAEKAGEVSGKIKNLASNTGAFSGPLGGSIGRLFSGAGKTLVGAASNFGKGVFGTGILQTLTGKSAEGIIGSLTGELASSDVLKAYEGLYLTEDTKFVYKFPYFDNTLLSMRNSFGSDDAISKSKYIKGLAGGFLEGEDIIAGMGAMQPGVYIEKPKAFQFADGGDSITFKFPLINTGWSTFEDVQRNWQLIYMLTYQNRPNRKTRDLIDPPCLYELMIPGVKYMPYAFISLMSVDFLGSRRSYYINVPSAGRIQTIIPDAYEISITFTSLIAESQNFLYHMIYEKQNIVNVNDGPVGILGSFLNGLTRGSSNQGLTEMAQKTNMETQKK